MSEPMKRGLADFSPANGWQMRRINASMILRQPPGAPQNKAGFILCKTWALASFAGACVSERKRC